MLNARAEGELPPHEVKEWQDAILASPLFDREFYKLHFMADADASPSEIAQHFLQYSAWDCRPPSPGFDMFQYSSVHRDVVQSGMPTFVHFSMFGQQEGRGYAPVPPHHSKKRALISDLAADGLSPQARTLKVAICAHLFYEDYAAVLADRLQDLPVDADIFISCRDEASAKVIRQDMAFWNKGKVDIRISPNRGRNFSPLLVTFANDLRNYDLIGHIHSKKSLFTGNVQKEWAFHSIMGVLGSREYDTAILNGFASKDDWGMVASENYYTMPGWALHELQNAPELNRLEKLLGVKRRSAFMDYPVGGMFWARQDVLKPLFDLALDYDDFPEEQGQIDGTLHHAIERMLGIITEHNKQKFIKYAPRSGILFSDSDSWKKTFQFHSHGQIQEAIRHHDVISFDFFDTLVMRDAAEVEEAKIRVAQRHADQSFADFPDYRAFRNACETAARAAKDWKDDVDFGDIARQMVATGAVDMAGAQALISEETEEDIALLLPRLPVVDFYLLAMRMGKRVVITSDSFYSPPFFEAVLDKFGIPRPACLYISSERGVRKDRGDMWSYVRAREKGSILHFGDNIVSDLQRAGDYGMITVYVPKATDKLIAMDILAGEPSSRDWPLVRELALSPLGSDPFYT